MSAAATAVTRAEEGTALEIYVSTDVETDGPIPGVYSMLSIGSAAYLPDSNRPHATFTANLETLPEASQHPDTMKWWKTQPEAWAACREDLEAPEAAMRRYLGWLKQLPGEPVFVAYPAAFDFMFVCWYLNRFAGENPFGWHALDIKTFAMALTGRDFLDTVKRNMPRNWFDDLPYTHKAIDDAVSQGALFCNMLAEHKRRLRAEKVR
ncbi:MAG: 3'-5' exoribonuclease [Acidobacteria bacterium]|nr:3'-5' exoribonuclease [Acidobacteriota bacterium]